MTALRDVLGALEQAQAGMIGGRAVTLAEAEIERRALAARLASLVDAATTPEDAAAMQRAIPPWARPLVDAALLGRLAERASRVVPPAPPPAKVRTRIGTFRWEDGAYVGKHPTLGVHVRIEDAGATELDARIDTHGWLVTRADAVVAAAKEHMARDGLVVHNDGYREPTERPLTAAEFAARLTLTSVELDEDESRLHFDDGDLFWGHCVWVVCDRDGAPRTTGMSG